MDELARGGEHEDGHPVDAHHLEGEVDDLVEQAVDLGLPGELLGDVEEEGEALGLALLLRLTADPEERAALGGGDPGGDVGRPGDRHPAEDGGVQGTDVGLGRGLDGLVRLFPELEDRAAEGDLAARPGGRPGHP